MKNFKSNVMLVSMIFAVLLGLWELNLTYWSVVAPLYVKDIFNLLPVESDGIKLPKLPGIIENNSTILGVDRDKNGIRDDVDHWIVEYGLNYNERMAMRDDFRLNQMLVYHAKEKDLSSFHETVKHLFVADACLDYISYTYRNANSAELSSLMRYGVLLSNDDRLKIYKNMTKSGYDYGPPDGIEVVAGKDYEHCKFKINNLNKLIKDREDLNSQFRNKSNHEK